MSEPIARLKQQMAFMPPWVSEAVSELIEDYSAAVAALRASKGYLLNAKIDLETGAPKRTAIATIEGGLKVVEAALAKGEPVSADGLAEPSNASESYPLGSIPGAVR